MVLIQPLVTTRADTTTTVKPWAASFSMYHRWLELRMLIQNFLVKTICRVPHRHLISPQPCPRSRFPSEHTGELLDSSIEVIWIQVSQHLSVSILCKALTISTTTDKLYTSCQCRLELLSVSFFLSTCTATRTSSVRCDIRIQRTHPSLVCHLELDCFQGTKRTSILVNFDLLFLLRFLGYGQHQSFAQPHVRKTRSCTSYTNPAVHSHASTELTSKEG